MVSAMSTAVAALSATTSQTQGAQKAASRSPGGGGTPPEARMSAARTAEETASQSEMEAVSCTLRTHRSAPGERSRFS